MDDERPEILPEPPKKPRWFSVGRLWDLAAVLVIAFVVYRIFVAPRVFNSPAAFPAPRVTYATLSGKPFVLQQHHGRVVFLDFWASWCEPCKMSLPLVESFARSHPEVDVVAVDEGEPRAVVAAFADAHHMHEVGLDPHTLSQGFFQLDGYPTMVVIDPNGRIRATWTGFNPAIEMNMSHAEKTLANAAS